MALMKCVECGGQVSDKASSCPHCGCPLGAVPQGISEDPQRFDLSDLRLESPEPQDTIAPQNTADDQFMNEDYYRAAIGKNADYYLEKFYKIANGSITVNIAALIFTSIWLLYRKMYLHFFILFSISLLICIIIELTPSLSIYMIEIDISFTVIYSMFYMFLGNTFYKKHIEKKIKRAQAQNRTSYTIIPWLQYHGGTSKIACFAGLAIYTILSVFAIFEKEIEQKIEQEEMKQKQQQPAHQSDFTPVKYNIIYGNVEITPRANISYYDSRA